MYKEVDKTGGTNKKLRRQERARTQEGFYFFLSAGTSHKTPRSDHMINTSSNCTSRSINTDIDTGNILIHSIKILGRSLNQVVFEDSLKWSLEELQFLLLT